MSVVKKFLFGAAGAALLATGAAGSAHAQMYAATDPCDMYAREYAAVNAPQFGFGGWDAAYRHAYNECLTGGPTFVGAPYTGPHYTGPFAPVDTAATLAGAALAAPLSVAGAAVTAGADIATGTAAALASPFDPAYDPALDPEFAPEPVAPATGQLNPPIHPTMSEPVVMRNYRGSFEQGWTPCPLSASRGEGIWASDRQLEPVQTESLRSRHPSAGWGPMEPLWPLRRSIGCQPSLA